MLYLITDSSDLQDTNPIVIEGNSQADLLRTLKSDEYQARHGWPDEGAEFHVYEVKKSSRQKFTTKIELVFEKA